MENCKTIKADRELLVNALKGMEISHNVLGEVPLPNKIIGRRFDGEPKVNANCLDEYSTDELYAIYQLLSGDESALNLYDGFTGKCQEEIDFEKEREQYMALLRKKQKDYSLADEIRDAIDFNIVHDLKANATSGVLTIHQMEAESEKVCERKFDEVVKALCSEHKDRTVSVSKVENNPDLVGKDYSRVDYNGSSILFYNTDALYMKLTNWKTSNDAVYRINISK